MSTSILIITPVLIIGLLIWIYNGIVQRYNAVDRAWASVMAQQRQKNKIIPHVESLVEQYKLHEASVLAEVTKLRNTLHSLDEKNMDTAKVAKAEEQTRSLIQGLKVAVEAYPDLKASDSYLKVMTEISEQQQQVGAAIRIFNGNVEDFNNAIQMFPGSFVNRLFNRKHSINSFSDKEAQADFEYKPNL